MANFDPPTAARRAGLRDGRIDRGSRAGQPGSRTTSRRGSAPIYKLDAIARSSAAATASSTTSSSASARRISSRSNPPGLLQHRRHSAASRATTPVLFMQRWVPDRTSSIRRTSILSRLLIRTSDANNPRHDGAAVRRRRRAADRRATSWRLGRRRSDRSTDNLAVLRNLNQNAARHARRQRRRCRTRTFGNVQWREMTGEGQLQGRRHVVREAVQQAATATARPTPIGEARDSGARAPRTPRRAAAERPRPRVVGRAERLRHPPSPRRQLHRRAAVRRRQAVRRRTASPRRSSAAGWSAASTARARAARSRLRRATTTSAPVMTGLPNLTGDPRAPRRSSSGINPAAFTPVPSGTFGNAGRNILRGPGWVTFDMSVQRRVSTQLDASTRRCGWTSSTSSTAPTSGCRTRTSSAPRPA